MSRGHCGRRDEEYSRDRMFVLVVVALATLSPILALPVAAPAQTLPTPDTVSDASVTLPQPANIKVDPLLQPVVDALLEKSPTLRRQWRAIGATRIVRVSLISSALLREATNARARTEVSRYESGAIGAVVELPTLRAPELHAQPTAAR